MQAGLAASGPLLLNPIIASLAPSDIDTRFDGALLGDYDDDYRGTRFSRYVDWL